MEKLQPLWIHRFWILFGVILIVPVYGWWGTTDAVRAATATREKALDSTFGKIPKKSTIKNQNWVNGIQMVRVLGDERFAAAQWNLSQTQLKYMKWPTRVAPYMKDVPYRGKLKKLTAVTLYSQDYASEMRRLRAIVSPYSAVTGKGQVILESGTLPRTEETKLKGKKGSWETMWNTQEDVWLTQSLLESIAKVNGGAANLQESSIRVISELRLLGGSTPQAAGATDGGVDKAKLKKFSRARGKDDAEADKRIGTHVRRTKGGKRGAEKAQGPKEDLKIDGSADFEPVEEFGPELTTGDFIEMADLGTSRPRIRYVDCKAELPYATRGFYIKVTMVRRSVPDLLVALTNSNWPVQIARVQQIDASASKGRGGRGGGGGLSFGQRGNRKDQGANTVYIDTSKDISAIALADPTLAEVTIAGKITLFTPRTGEPPKGASSELAANTK